MTDNQDVVKDELKKKTLQAKNKAIEVKKGALKKTADAKDSALMKTSEIKESASNKTSEIKESASNKTSEIKESASNKTSEIKESASDKTEEFKGNAEKTRKQAEKKINEFISTLKDKQEEFGKTISDYTSVDKPLTDVINTENSIIIKADLPLVKKEDISVNITEDSIEIVAKFEEQDENLDFIKRERNYGVTSRTIPLPVKIEVKKASAKFLNSVLTVELPKIQEEKIKVKIA
jgi:HSP20 family protein